MESLCHAHHCQGTKVFALTLVAGLAACASEPTTDDDPRTNLRGTVTLNGEPAAGITIGVFSAVTSPGTGSMVTTVTGADGGYSFFVEGAEHTVGILDGLPADAVCQASGDGSSGINLGSQTSRVVSIAPDGVAVVRFDCETRDRGTGGTGGAAGSGGSGGGTAGTGGAPVGACTEDDVVGEAQLAGQPSADAPSIQPGGIVNLVVRVDGDVTSIEALLLSTDGISFAGSGDATTVGGEAVEVELQVSVGAPPGNYFIEIALLPDANSPDDFTLYTLAPPSDTQENYDRVVFVAGAGSGATPTTCPAVRLEILAP